MTSLFDFDLPPDQYAVMGNPITHSKSPQIHAAFAQHTQQRIQYSAIQVDHGGFAQAVGNFFANGGKGLNVTVPFKQEAWHLCAKRSDRAELAGAVNTLKMQSDGLLFGDNTDGAGLVRDLTENLSVEIRNKSILLVGAGGAARGVIKPLLDEHPEKLYIVNRTVDKAIFLAQLFSRHGNLAGCGFGALADMQFDIVINASSTSLQGDLPPLPAKIFNPQALSYDMMYAAQPTPFMQWSTANNASHVSDGLGMLVEQAAESFFIWRGVKPQTHTVIQAMRVSLESH